MFRAPIQMFSCCFYTPQMCPERDGEREWNGVLLWSLAEIYRSGTGCGNGVPHPVLFFIRPCLHYAGERLPRTACHWPFSFSSFRIPARNGVLYHRSAGLLPHWNGDQNGVLVPRSGHVCIEAVLLAWPLHRNGLGNGVPQAVLPCLLHFGFSSFSFRSRRSCLGSTPLVTRHARSRPLPNIVD